MQIKLNFAKKTSNILYLVKTHYNIKRYIPGNINDVEYYRNPINLRLEDTSYKILC